MSSDLPSTPDRDQAGQQVALLIIDMINPFDFEGGRAVRKEAERIAPIICRLRQDADRLAIPTIYVNDNFGEWHSEKTKLVKRAQPSVARGIIEPRDKDFFIIKPQFSGFYSTNLGVLLPKLGVRRLILTGIATEICVIFTAADAHMRDYDLWVPEDAVVSLDQKHGEAALAIIEQRIHAEIAKTAEMKLEAWLEKGFDESLRRKLGNELSV